MASTKMITDNQDELTIEELFRDADQIQIPVFQRAYVWTKKEFDQLETDIRLIRSGEEKSQFLGAVVAYESKRETSAIGRLKTISIVDGQQRILTLYIFIIALVESFASIGEKDLAIDIVRQFLLVPPRRGLGVNTRLFPAYGDRSQFRIICDKINSPEILQEFFDEISLYPPPPSGESSGNLLTQYNRISNYLKREVEKNPSGKSDVLEEIFEIVVRKLTFVHLVLNEASGANKIFERLNFRGKRVGTIDLVRNEIFSGMTDDPTESSRIFDHFWNPFVKEFNGRSDSFFFPYCLVHNNNVTKSDLFTELRQIWGSKDPEEIIAHMKKYQPSFLGVDSTGRFGSFENVSTRLDRLVRMGRPSSIYPFIMTMLTNLQEGKVDEEICVEMLDVVESFLVRRAISGYEPTGLHALFKSLWGDLNEYTGKELKEKILDRPTIQWPNDLDFDEAIQTRPIAKAKICNYLLVEYDRCLPGDHPSIKPTIEHILPQSYDSESKWAEVFTKEEHKKLKDTWSNLIPLTEPLNSSLQASPYKQKQPRYRDESMFITPRRIADTYDHWNKESVSERAKKLSSWAIKRWRYDF